MGLNSRKAQIIWPIVCIAFAGLILELPFFWRAMKTRKRGDVTLAACFGVAQIAVYAAFAFDQSPDPSQVSNITGSVVWLCTLSAAAAAAWVYRPLSKEERMDQANQSQRPGSSYL